MNRTVDLPDFCFSHNEVTDEVILIKKGEKGYYPYYDGSFKGKEKAHELNEQIGVTRQQSEAMKAGSMFGWNVPASNPDLYDENGNVRKDML